MGLVLTIIFFICDENHVVRNPKGYHFPTSSKIVKEPLKIKSYFWEIFGQKGTFRNFKTFIVQL